jgi:hypothetical protein
MAAQERSRRLRLALGIVVLLIPASQIFRYFTQRSDIWWTPKALSVPLVESADRVEIYVRGQLLQELLDGQRLQVLTDRGPFPLGVSDVGLRFNNVDRVRARQIPLLLGAAVATGVVGAFVVLSALGLWPAGKPTGV